MLGTATLVPGFCMARTALDSLVLERIWNYKRNYTQAVGGVEQNMYMRCTYGTERRNPTLFLVPTMYTIARGERDFIGESYGRMTFRGEGDYELRRQVVCGTIPRNRSAMSTVVSYTTPNLYGMSIYREHLLSPFHRSNRHVYRYRVSLNADDSRLAVVRFTPRVTNTQLVNGHAVVDVSTGRLLTVSFEGEFDMVSFRVTAVMSRDAMETWLPERCITEARFTFLGNKVTSTLSAVYNCPTSLPDSVDERDDRTLMATLRPIPLKRSEEDIYCRYDSLRSLPADSTETDSVQTTRKGSRMKEILWDIIGDNLINSTHADAGAMSMSVSPLLNPLYLGYSHSRGISYKLRVGLRYSWNAHRYLTLTPQLGYNFKQRQFYYTAPLRMTYNPKRNGYAEIVMANGNRIGSGALTEAIQQLMGKDFKVPDFKDEYISAANNVVAFDWLELTTGVVYHRRTASNRNLMRELQMAEEFRSFAPRMKVRLTPWHNAPVLTVNYERSIKNVLRSDLDYEQWELDASYKKKMSGLRYFNFRGGTGFYTQRSSNYFVDYNNFHENNLPTGWEDDWSGQFQLLNSRWYNESNYYVRSHASYESPLLALTWLPWAGRVIETERLYVSALSIQHTRPYFELGYGFSNRFFSTGIFASFLDCKFQRFGCKFTIELFRRW